MGEIRAWVLHRRPFRDNSFIVDLLCEDLGLCRVVWRRPKRGYQGEPFTPILAKLSGKGEMKSLSRVEAISSPLPITGNYLYSAMYVNELTTLLLPQGPISASFFVAYRQALVALSSEESEMHLLRKYERALFDELGIWPSIHAGMDPQKYYTLNAYDGLTECASDRPNALSGGALVALDNFNDPRQCAIVHRRLIDQLLQGKEINSRALYAAAIGK